MRADLLSALTGWLLTYWVHATVLLAAAALLTRLRIMSFAGRDLLWKCALVGPLFTATAHSLIASMPARHLDMAPARPSRGACAGPRVASRSPKRGHPSRNRAVTTPAALRRATGVPSSCSPGSPSRRCCSSGSWRDASGSCSASGAGIRSPMPAFATCSRRSASPPAIRTTCGSRRRPDSPAPSPFRAGRSACRRRSSPTSAGSSSAACSRMSSPISCASDPLWLGIAQVMERLFFLQPLNWLARRELQVTAEYVCDDWAAHQVGFGTSARPLPPHRGRMDRGSHRSAAGAGHGRPRFAPHASRRAPRAR